MRAGASALHIHPRDNGGRESLAAEVIDQTVRAVRAAAGVPVGVSTGAWIEPDPARRAAAVAVWREPDMASVNMSEQGAAQVMEALLGAGIAVEAGIWSVDDAELLADSGFTGRLPRVLVEIVRPSENPAADALAIDQALDRLGITAPRLHHGEGEATWPVLYQAVRLGRDIRTGLEDTLHLPDGTDAPLECSTGHGRSPPRINVAAEHAPASARPALPEKALTSDESPVNDLADVRRPVISIDPAAKTSGISDWLGILAHARPNRAVNLDLSRS